MDSIELEKIIRSVIQEIDTKNVITPTQQTVTNAVSSQTGFIDDIGLVDLSRVLNVENPFDREAYMEMKSKTPARIGVGRCGPRPKTSTLLRLRADHAAAMDAVFSDVSEETLKEVGLFSITTTSADKAEFLSDPATGKVIDEENKKILLEKCIKNPDVQIVVADGLSSTSIEANIRDILPALVQGVKQYGYTMGTPFFIKHGRVASMDYVTDILKPKVTVLLIGERPGLVTGESLSCYMTYGGYIDMAEAMRTVVSNIYKRGMPPAEAGAHIAGIVKRMMENKASGLELK